jgi:hyperosmotically inducible periplasmic protein
MCRLRWRGALLLIVIVATAGSCRTVDPLADVRIESEVKARLVAEKAANLTRLGVLSSQGTVYLSGTLASAAEKARAETIAKGVPGVRRVVSTVEIRSATD